MRSRYLIATAAALLLAACSSSSPHTDRVRWQLVTLTDSTASIQVGHGACDKDMRYRVDETTKTVTITVTVVSSGGRACTADLRVARLDVRLPHPVGNRALRGCDPTPMNVDADCRTYTFL